MNEGEILDLRGSVHASMHYQHTYFVKMFLAMVSDGERESPPGTDDQSNRHDVCVLLARSHPQCARYTDSQWEEIHDKVEIAMVYWSRVVSTHTTFKRRKKASRHLMRQMSKEQWVPALAFELLKQYAVVADERDQRGGRSA